MELCVNQEGIIKPEVSYLVYTIATKSNAYCHIFQVAAMDTKNVSVTQCFPKLVAGPRKCAEIAVV